MSNLRNLGTKLPAETWYTEARQGRDGNARTPQITSEDYLQHLNKVMKEARNTSTSLYPGLYPDVDNFTREDRWDDNHSKRHRIQNVCRNLYLHNELGRNIINQYVTFTLGEGIDFHFNVDDEDRQDRFDRRMRSFRDVNHLDRLIRQAITMTYTLGEWFWVEPEMDESERKEARKRGIVGVRPLDPTHVREIKWKDHDPLNPTELLLENNATIDFDRVIHFKINDDLRHGRPIMEPVRHRVLQIENMIEDLVAVSNIRSRLPVLRKVSDDALVTPPREMPDRGTILTVNAEGEEWEFPSFDLGGREIPDEVVGLVQAVARGVNLPSFMVSKDLSQAGGFGQIPIARIEVSKMFGAFQRMFNDAFKDFATRVVPQVDKDNVNVVWPEPDFSSEERKLQLADQALRSGLISQRTAQEWIGVDPDKENERMEEEGEIPSGGGAAGGGLGGGGLGGFGQTGGAAGGGASPAGGGASPGGGGASPAGDGTGNAGGQTSGGPQPSAEDQQQGFVPPELPTAPGGGGGQSGGINLGSPGQGGGLNLGSQGQGGGLSFGQQGGSLNLGSQGGGSVNFGSQGNIRFNGNGRLLLEQQQAEVVMGMDFGWTDEGALVLGRVEEGKVKIFDEFSVGELPVIHSDEDPEMHEIRPGVETCCWTCLADEMEREHNAKFLFPDPRSPEDIQILEDRLNLTVDTRNVPVDESQQVIQALRDQGKFLVHQDCRMLHEDCQRGEGHVFDATRYLIVGAIAQGMISLDEGNNDGQAANGQGSVSLWPSSEG